MGMFDKRKKFQKILGPLARDNRLLSLDIGARGVVKSDLALLGNMVDIVGFEPDKSACDKLNADYAHRPGPWGSVRFIDQALGSERKEETLHITHKGGTSSIYRPCAGAGALFGREGYYTVRESVPIHVDTLDSVARKYSIGEADHIKLDVEGYELEVLKGAGKMCAGLSAIRIEIVFHDLREGQPRYFELFEQLDAYGLMPMGFVELHHWRNSTKIKYPRKAAGPIPYSRGQMIHGDLLFFRKLDALPLSGEGAVKKAVRYALISLCYGYVDHAQVIFNLPEVAAYLRSRDVQTDGLLRCASLLHKPARCERKAL